MAPPADRRYARPHVWARREEGGCVRVGLTHVPARFLGDVVYVELPEPGALVFAGEPVGLVESSSTVYEVAAPIEGAVAEINRGMEISPERITADPYGEGWLFTIRPADPAAVDALLTGEEYERLVEEE